MTRATVCVPITEDGLIDPRWGRAERMAVAEVGDDGIAAWREVDVGWGRLHDAGGEGEHHARIARFLKENGVTAVVAHHMGPGMVQMLGKMGIAVHLGASGGAREAALQARAG